MTDDRPSSIEPESALVQKWSEAFQKVEQRSGGRYARSEAREQALSYLTGC